MSSWFSSSSATPRDPSSSVHPVQSRFTTSTLFGPLVQQDTEWLCSSGFVTETQTFYSTTAAGALVMCQVIHSNVSSWYYPSIQFTFRYVDASQKINVWKSTTVTNFTSAPSPSLDKRSSKSDQFSVTLDPASPNRYTITGKYDDEIQISMVFERLAEGWKLGAGPRGGITYFGKLADEKPTTDGAPGSGVAPDLTSGSDGFASHRFWPRCAVSGIIRVGQSIVDLEDARGIFVHAIQGMRPDSLATRWNFANFQSTVAGGEGVSLTMMEFKTTSAYGDQVINVGSIVVGDKLLAITAGGLSDADAQNLGSSAEHLDSQVDAETGYAVPGKISFLWSGQSVTNAEKDQAIKANLMLDLMIDMKSGAYDSRGFIEKVDVLREIPYLLKKFVSYAVGTKPFIYTWLNPAKVSITLPSALNDVNSQEEKTMEVDGVVFNEATFVS